MSGLNQQKDSAKQRNQIFLAIIIILGIALVAVGLWGMQQFENTHFHEEIAFDNIHDLSAELSNQYDNQILPYVQQGAHSNLNKAVDDVIINIWSTKAKSDKTEYVMHLKESAHSPEDLQKQQWKLLSAAFTFDGPRIKEKNLKAIAAMSPSEKDEFRRNLLKFLDGENVTLPQVAYDIMGDKQGVDLQADILQTFLLSGDANAQPISDELTKNLKRNIRDAEGRIIAATWAEDGHVTNLVSFIVTFARTIVLIGALMIIDALIMIFVCLKSKDWNLDFKWIIILAIVDFLLVFQVLPMIYLLVKSLFPEGSFTLTTFTRLYTHSMNLEAMKNTLLISAATMVLGTLLAFPLAWLVGRTDLYGKKFFRGLFVITYMVPPYVGAMAWLRLLNPNVGSMNVFIRELLNLNITTGPINIYSIGGLIWVLTTFYYPYAFITISRAMEKMDPSLEEASKISGANPIVTVFRITLPMMLPSLIAGALLVFIGAASAYGIPAIIGAPGKVHTVTTRIVEYFGLGSTGLNDAIGMAVFLMMAAMAILYISDNVIAKKQYITVSGKSTRPSIVELGKWRIPLTVVISLFAVLVIFIPFLTILTTSLKFDIGKSLFDPNNFTLKQWSEIFTRGETISSLKNSVLFAIVAATVGIGVSITMSYLLQRTKVAGRKIPDFLITLSSSSPSVVIALGLIMTMKGNFGVSIYNTPSIIIIAYLLKYLMMGMRTVVSAMSQIHVSLEECSQISGASWLKTMFKITGPLIFPSIAAGWFLIFIPSFYELSMTTLLYSNTTKTIGFQLYEYWIYHNQPQACAMAFGILIIVVMLNFVLNRITKGEFSI